MTNVVGALERTSVFFLREAANAVTTFIAPVESTWKFVRGDARRFLVVTASSLGVAAALVALANPTASLSPTDEPLLAQTKPITSLSEQRGNQQTVPRFNSNEDLKVTNAKVIADAAHSIRASQKPPIKFRIVATPSTPPATSAAQTLMLASNLEKISKRLRRLEYFNNYRSFNIYRVEVIPIENTVPPYKSTESLTLSATQVYASLQKIERDQGSPIEINGIENIHTNGSPMLLSTVTLEDLNGFIIKEVEIRADPPQTTLSMR